MAVSSACASSKMRARSPASYQMFWIIERGPKWLLVTRIPNDSTSARTWAGVRP
ncbi:hypothetical protein [Georgenia sp. SUBG003]|uniref:hypothetical protein n=1 Tax=Georgenia sp. SUBG003 TaxID=1497974 RepID=UPI003AB5A63F